MLQSHDEDKKDIVYTGLIAQEVLSTARLLGYDFSGVKVPEDEVNGQYGIRYAEFVVPLIKATQELSEQNKQQQALIERQMQMLNTLEASLNKTQSDLQALKAQVEANTAAVGFSAK